MNNNIRLGGQPKLSLSSISDNLDFIIVNKDDKYATSLYDLGAQMCMINEELLKKWMKDWDTIPKEKVSIGSPFSRPSMLDVKRLFDIDDHKNKRLIFDKDKMDDFIQYFEKTDIEERHAKINNNTIIRAYDTMFSSLKIKKEMMPLSM
eukprot:Awhi_evm1s2948